MIRLGKGSVCANDGRCRTLKSCVSVKTYHYTCHELHSYILFSFLTGLEKLKRRKEKGGGEICRTQLVGVYYISIRLEIVGHKFSFDSNIFVYYYTTKTIWVPENSITKHILNFKSRVQLVVVGGLIEPAYTTH